MGTSFKRKMLQTVNQVLSVGGVELIRKDKEFQDYIPLKKTLADAEQAGMHLGDYIDMRFNVPGVTQATIDKMAEPGVFSGNVQKVCEIGLGSGRYLEKVINICRPEYYEVYETSKDWREWLVEKYKVIPQSTDGISLASTPSGSVNLVHAHKILYGNPVITIGRYLIE